MTYPCMDAMCSANVRGAAHRRPEEGRDGDAEVGTLTEGGRSVI